MFFNKTPTIEEDAIVEEWSQLVLGMGNKGEELLKRVAQKIQELNMPNVTLLRKEARLGQSNNRYEFVSIKHDKYPDYELWIGAIDRAGQLKASWFLTISLPNTISAKMRAINQASKNPTGIREVDKMLNKPSGLIKQLGRMAGNKLSEKISGKPRPIRVRPEDMTMDDKEEFGVFMTLAHQAVLSGLEEVMNDLNLDFSKVDKHSQGFLNLS